MSSRSSFFFLAVLFTTPGGEFSGNAVFKSTEHNHQYDLGAFCSDDGSPLSVGGNTTHVAITLSGLSHARVLDMDMLLVLTFADDAQATISSFLHLFGGVYKPTSGDAVTDAFPAPASAGDYDGDGRIDLAVFRPGDSIWYVKRSSDNQPSFFQWGIATDKPIPNAFVR